MSKPHEEEVKTIEHLHRLMEAYHTLGRGYTIEYTPSYIDDSNYMYRGVKSVWTIKETE